MHVRIHVAENIVEGDVVVEEIVELVAGCWCGRRVCCGGGHCAECWRAAQLAEVVGMGRDGVVSKRA